MHSATSLTNDALQGTHKRASHNGQIASLRLGKVRGAKGANLISKPAFRTQLRSTYPSNRTGLGQTLRSDFVTHADSP